MKLLRFILKTSPRIIFIATVIGVISGASSAGLISLIHKILNNGEFRSAIWIWRFVALVLVAITSGVTSQWLSVYLSQKAMADLRMNLSYKIITSPLQHLEKLGIHRLLATLTNDVIILSRSIILVPRLVISATTLVGGILYMAWLSLTGCFLLLGFILLAVIIYHALTKRAMTALKTVREEQDALFKHFRALTNGIKELKLNWNRRQYFLSHNLQPTVDSFRQTYMFARTLFVASENLTRFLFFILCGLFLFVLPLLKGIDTEILTGYLLTTLYLFRPVGTIMYIVPGFGRAVVALQKIEDLELSLADQAKEVYSTAQPKKIQSWERIELDGITHTYSEEKDDSHFTVGPINLDFRPGELVFLVGGNGSGKTTLAKVITGLYTPEAGEIRLNGTPITDKNRENYRQLFSVVFSDFYLFANLLGLEDPAFKVQAQDYLVALQLDHKVTIHNGVFSTTDLSQGQRKRLILLNAYLDDRPFYLFDEWAADQDPVFKKIFYTQILPELKAKGKTVLVITHDDQYFHIADRHIKMVEGQVQKEPVEIL